ncbi:MAG: SusC/RagA family TonB-linked outer membrane protein [Bacteroidales bacterium]|nr:SusC/RagA family TonB-linked outer membrane protein [Bacteroidales bacterium]
MYKTELKSLFVTMVLTLGLSITLFAQNRVTLNCKDVSLREVMEQIQQQTSLSFAFTDNIDADKIKISATANNADLESTLKKILAPYGITYRIVGKQIILNPIKAQTTSEKIEKIRVSGVIKDDMGEIIPGAVIKDTKSSTYSVADANGNYQISVIPDTRLNFSAIGFEEQTIPLNGRSVLDITLNPDIEVLDDVIVTGYQTISKERSTASFSVIKGDEVKSSAMARGSILEGLEGAAAGFTVNTANNAEQKYLVRGITSIHSNQEPLFVLDGVAVSTEDVESLLSANDVASVTVLKDATAVSIWGSRAANGVIVITSKTGKNTNGRINVSYDGNFTFKGIPSLEYYKLMDSKTFIKNAVELFENPDYQTAYSWDIVTNSKDGLGIMGYDTPVVFPHEQILYDWQRGIISKDERDRKLGVLANQDGYAMYKDLMMTNMWNTSHNISLSGGTDRFKVFGSFGYEGDQGNFHNTDNTYKMNIKQEYKVSKWLTWDLTLNVSHSERSEHHDFMNLINWDNPYSGMLPYAMLKNEDGTWADYNEYAMYAPERARIERELGISTEYHPVEDFFKSFRKTKDTRVRANTGLKANIWNGIAYELRFQYLRGASNQEFYIPGETWQVRHDRISATTMNMEQILPERGGDFEVNDSFTSDWTVRNQISYNGSFDGSNHQITALIGTEYRENKTKGYYSYERGYDYQTMTNTSYDITAANGFFMNYFGDYGYVQTDESSQSENVLRYVSYYGNLAYTFKNKYSINGSARIDQSNLFGTDVNSQYKPIGSVGLSWRIKEEKFMQSADWVNNLTLRASWGHSGNSPLPTMGGPYDIIGVYVGGSNFENNNGYVIKSPSNKKIGWEKTRTWNLGVDFSFLNYRINGALDLYHKKTTDLLSDKALNILTGYSSIYANVGSLENKGIELSLNTVNIQSKEFTWTSNLNISYNKNKVLEYYKVPTTSLWEKIYYGAYTEGYAAGAIWGIKWAGLRHEDGVPQAYDAEGNIQYDYNKFEANDAYCLGTTVPKWSGSFTNTFSYKGFDLTAMFIFNLGHKMSVYGYTSLSGRLNYNRSSNLDNRWRKPGDEEHTIIPSAYEDPYYANRDAWGSSSLFGDSDVMYDSASYAKLRELTLSYNLPKKACDKLRIQGMRFRVTGHDLLKIVANSRGIDPEIGLGADSYGAYWSAGLSINF